MPVDSVKDFPPYRLAEALYAVVQRVEDWRSAVNTFYQLPRSEHLYDKMDQAKRQLVAAVDAAIAAIPNVDRYVRVVRGSRPGQWSSALKLKLGEFKAAVFTQSDSLVRGKEGRILLEWRNCFHEEQRFLRSIDRSAFDGQAVELPGVADNKDLGKTQRKAKPHHRPQIHDPLRDEKIVADWKASQATANKPTRAQFEKMRGMRSGELKKTIDRHRKRPKRDGAAE
ncbi:MAG: hypothetical protein MUP47_06590 [Phycisphaerae bacterium]|nr:hypothetical protein [Phycisphaerae bacterium]